MKSSSDLLSFEILPLSEVKATFSEQIKKTRRQGKRIAVTINGKPMAVLLSYDDFLDLLQASGESKVHPEVPEESPERVIRYIDWKRDAALGAKARDSILNLFDTKKLSRKGQKAYKKDLVDEFTRGLKKKNCGTPPRSVIPPKGLSRWRESWRKLCEA